MRAKTQTLLDLAEQSLASRRIVMVRLLSEAVKELGEAVRLAQAPSRRDVKAQQAEIDKLAARAVVLLLRYLETEV